MKEFIVNFRREFELLPPEDIGLPRSVNGVRKYGDSTSIYKKGTIMHVKGALLYNHLLKIKRYHISFNNFMKVTKASLFIYEKMYR